MANVRLHDANASGLEWASEPNYISRIRLLAAKGYMLNV